MNCFTEIWKNSWILTLRDWEILTWKEIWIKNKWTNWINVDNLALFWLENEEEKDGMNLRVNLQNTGFFENLDLRWSGEKIEVLCRLE